jgi:hypothetical protein
LRDLLKKEEKAKSRSIAAKLSPGLCLGTGPSCSLKRDFRNDSVTFAGLELN